MSKRKTMDQVQARERRNRLLASAASAELSLTAGVREMRAIAGMTQDEFARHRGVSARVIKAIELGQGNPTVATMNRIGQFFGLEVAFVPIRRDAPAGVHPPAADGRMVTSSEEVDMSETIRKFNALNGELVVRMGKLNDMVSELDVKLHMLEQQRNALEGMANPSPVPAQAKRRVQIKRRGPDDAGSS